ncbi:hypothetical protein Dda_0659 [Drechslerella dactyloides]|uniref:Uncharacterized protein n=1 Tax=Drechslerella dactyloides TaxID=74499 RepID=A0AAD6J641_DREDA|nr:hypothetical protein Dda_0659 [Drechslerella dactyloides]
MTRRRGKPAGHAEFPSKIPSFRIRKIERRLSFDISAMYSDGVFPHNRISLAYLEASDTIGIVLVD